MSNDMINKSLDGMAVSISSLKSDKKNARRHSQQNIKAIKDSLRMFGQQKPIVVTDDMTVIAGNGTLHAAKELGWSRIAVVKFDSEQDARAFAIADNRTAELAEWDVEELKLQMTELRDGGLNISDIGFSDNDFASLTGELSNVKTPSVEPNVDAAPRNSSWKVITGDSKEVLAGMPENSFSSCVCDPPYEIGIVGRDWDKTGIAFDPELWRCVHRVLKPGAITLAFSAAKNYHKLAVAMEDAGFEVRDMIAWVYATGFPSYFDVSAAIDKKLGAAREDRTSIRRASGAKISNGSEYKVEKGTPKTAEAIEADGFFARLRQCIEPIVFAVKRSDSTIVENVIRNKTGVVNLRGESERTSGNVISDGVAFGGERDSAFYCVKPNKAEKEAGVQENIHATPKPVDLMRHLVKLVTMPGQMVLDPFCGSGTTGIGCVIEGFDFTGIELMEEHADIARKRIEWWHSRAVKSL